jgi:FkbM family methyltransferase
MVRLGRFVSNEARLDNCNDPSTNGELLVQSCLTRLAPEREPCVVFDVGANVGRWSRSLVLGSGARQSPFLVHAFEPCGDTFATLSENLKAWGMDDRVRAHRLALSAEEGERPFFSLGKDQGRNSLYPHRGEAGTAETVPCCTLDAWCRREGVEDVLFVKIDTEGNDYQVLIGAREMLAAGRIGMVQFEYNQRWIAARRFLLDAFDFLLPLGYAIGKVTAKGVEYYDTGWDVELETFREGNYLAVRPEHRPVFPEVKWWKVG